MLSATMASTGGPGAYTTPRVAKASVIECATVNAVIVPTGHELENADPLTLEAIAEWPIITYDPGFTGRSRIDQAFAKEAIVPDIIMTALDADARTVSREAVR